MKRRSITKEPDTTTKRRTMMYRIDIYSAPEKKGEKGKKLTAKWYTTEEQAKSAKERIIVMGLGKWTKGLRDSEIVTKRPMPTYPEEFYNVTVAGPFEDTKKFKC